MAWTASVLEPIKMLQEGEYVGPEIDLTDKLSCMMLPDTPSWNKDLIVMVTVERSLDDGKTWEVFRQRRLLPTCYNKPFGFCDLKNYPKMKIRLRYSLNKSASLGFTHEIKELVK